MARELMIGEASLGKCRKRRVVELLALGMAEIVGDNWGGIGERGEG
jgi:hypothetical protein